MDIFLSVLILAIIWGGSVAICVPIAEKTHYTKVWVAVAASIFFPVLAVIIYLLVFRDYKKKKNPRLTIW